MYETAYVCYILCRYLVSTTTSKIIKQNLINRENDD